MRILYIASGFQGLTPASYGIGTAVCSAAIGMTTRDYEVQALLPSHHRTVSTVGGVVCHEYLAGDIAALQGNPYWSNLSVVWKSADRPDRGRFLLAGYCCPVLGERGLSGKWPLTEDDCGEVR